MWCTTMYQMYGGCACQANQEVPTAGRNDRGETSHTHLTILILKSMPMVVMKVGLKVSWVYCSSRHVLPTPVQKRGQSK